MAININERDVCMAHQPYLNVHTLTQQLHCTTRMQHSQVCIKAESLSNLSHQPTQVLEVLCGWLYRYQTSVLCIPSLDSEFHR